MVSLKQILSIHGSACLARRLQEPSRAFLICINRTDFNNTCRVNQLGWHLWCPIRFQRGPVIPPLWLRPRHLGWTGWSGGRLCARHEAGLSGGREENIQQTAGYSGQCQPSSAHCHQPPEELVQQQHAPPQVQHQQTEKQNSVWMAPPGPLNC